MKFPSFLAVFSLFAAASFVPLALAQTPPPPSIAANYEGLFAAAWNGDADEIRKLVSEGADVHETDGNGRTPFHVAAFASKSDAMRALVEGGADPNRLEDDKYDAVTIAAVADDVETLKTALEVGNSAGNTTSIYDGTALIAAAHLGHDEVVKVLIDAGAPLDHINNLHWTAVMESVVLGDGGERHIKTLKHLIDAGADASITDRQGRTPLDHARQRGYTAMVQILEAAN